MPRDYLVYGVRELKDGNSTFQHMLRVKQACEDAGVSYPPEVQQYFNGEAEESEDYLRDGMQLVQLIDSDFEYNTRDGQESWEVRLDKLPKDFVAVRFVIAY